MKGKKKVSPPQSNLFDELELPEGWTLTKIRDLVTINYGKGLKDADRAGGSVSVYGSNGIVGSHNKALTDGPSIIIGRKGSIGEVHYSPNPSWPIDTTYYIDKFEGIDQTFLVFALKSLNLSDLDTSTAIPGLNRNDIYDQEIPLPSLAEQKRIVARVEALLTHVNAACDRLNRVPLIMKKFRQAVLAAACSGRLTEGWREENVSQISSEVFLKQALDFRRRYCTKKSNKKYKEPVMLSDEFPFSLPDEWKWATLDQISQFVTDGDHYPPKRVPTGIPHLTSKHVKKWKLSYEDCSFISHEDYEIVKVRYEPQEGDVILTCVGTIGETAIVPEKFVFSADRNLAAIRLFPEFFLPQMLQFILNSAPWENHIKTVSGSTAQPHIYLKDLRAMAVPHPPLAEQHEIVRRVGLLFERADAFDQEVVAASRRCERLKQAVLGKAFRGGLIEKMEPGHEIK